ncbi:sterol desaturase family protein [Solimonas terrae]|uniref:Fatty acid hydroxylase domain-containing protein n=1 Tax=Solimonas terrae TaxID=1396819 RepID=A0A6M2BQM7_9GAMM|nr:sterol desaturase family protein [Solimonas terrae]NGY04654.1 hypothetical protein [Solimonas terrae]
MEWFSLEHGRTAYRADFVLYAGLVITLVIVLIVNGPRLRLPEFGALALTGLVGWSLIEYLLHRFVLHGLPPFRGWHAEHHRRPQALLGVPTVLSAPLIAAFVYLPALLLSDAWSAGALSLGVLAGYLAYSVTHHATHHWHGGNAWLKRRKRWHALHHHAGSAGRYGVSTVFWDHVFHSDESKPPPVPDAGA